MSVCVRDATLDGVATTLRAVDGVVTELGAKVTVHNGDEVLDGSGLALLPGFVNGHTHAAMTLMRGYADDLPLERWLEDRVWPVEAKLTADDVYWGTRLACLEMARGGTVRFWDMYWHTDAIARAARDAGMRAVIAAPIVDILDLGEDMKAAAVETLDRADDYGPLVNVALGPHSIYTASAELLRWVAETSATRDVPVHIHVAETQVELDDCRRDHGCGPVEYLDRVGLLGSHTVLAHCVHATAAELELIAERGATVVTNPSSNLKLAVGGLFRYKSARARGVSVGLGTDGAASNNSLDVLADVKVLALLAKFEARDPSVLPAHEAFDVLTGRLAGRLGQSGRVAVGEPADFCLVRLDAAELAPGNLVSNLVYAATGAVVDTTVVAGRVLSRGHRVLDEADILDEVRARAARLGTFGAS